MFHLSAIDADFLTRLFVGMALYWVVGVFIKGIFEPLQARMGRWLVSTVDRKIQRLQALSDITGSALDDRAIDPIAKLSRKLKIIIFE